VLERPQGAGTPVTERLNGPATCLRRSPCYRRILTKQVRVAPHSPEPFRARMWKYQTPLARPLKLLLVAVESRTVSGTVVALWFIA